MKTTLTSRELQNFLELLEQKRMTPERFSAILKSGRMADLLDPEADLNVERAEFQKALRLNELRVTVDYSTFDLGIAARILAGEGSMHGNIWEWFPVKGEGRWQSCFETITLFDDTLPDHALQLLAEKKLQPARIEELISFGLRYPSLFVGGMKPDIVSIIKNNRGGGYPVLTCVDNGNYAPVIDQGDWNKCIHSRTKVLGVSWRRELSKAEQ